MAKAHPAMLTTEVLGCGQQSTEQGLDAKNSSSDCYLFYFLPAACYSVYQEYE
jgi:hypothetical protein